MNLKSIIPHSRPQVEDREIAVVAQALRAGHLAQGEEVARLEAELADLYPGTEAVVVSSGTAALYLALRALGVTAGAKVILPSYTCQSLYAAVAHAGGAPVCADSGPGSVCLAAGTVAPLLDKNVGAIIVPHMFGYLADMEALLELGCPVIEDCAQAVGGRYPDGARVGSKGRVAILSFYATKLIPAGEGGACLTRDRGLAATIRLLRTCDKQALHPQAFNFKMADMNAALARAKLQALADGLGGRERLAQRYDRAFGPHAFRRQSAASQAVCFRYLLCADRADFLLEQAQAAGIQCRRPVWRPLHYDLGGACPRARRLQETLVSIPFYPNLSGEEVDRICAALPKMLA